MVNFAYYEQEKKKPFETNINGFKISEKLIGVVNSPKFRDVKLGEGKIKSYYSYYFEFEKNIKNEEEI